MNIIDYIPNIINEALFDGDASYLYLAKIILCVAIIFGSAVPLFVVKPDLPIRTLMAFEIMLVLALTGLGWMDATIMILMIFALALGIAEPIIKRMMGTNTE